MSFEDNDEGEFTTAKPLACCPGDMVFPLEIGNSGGGHWTWDVPDDSRSSVENWARGSLRITYVPGFRTFLEAGAHKGQYVEGTQNILVTLVPEKGRVVLALGRGPW